MMLVGGMVLVMCSAHGQVVSWCNSTATELVSGTAPLGTVSMSEENSKLTLRADLPPGEFVSEVLAFRPWTPLSPFEETGVFTPPTLSWGVNHAPDRCTFPLEINFSTSNRGGGVERFDGEDSQSWTVQYLILFGAKSPGADETDPGRWSFVAHIHGIGPNGDSGWIGAPITVVPETKKTVLIFCLGLLAFAGWRKFRR